MALDRLAASVARTEPPQRVPVQKSLDQISGYTADVLWEHERCRAQLGVQFLAVFRVPRRQPRQHLEEQHAKGPPVYRSSIPAGLAVQDLWGEVFGGTAEGAGPRVGRVDTFLRETEICKPDVPLGIQQHVLGLEVAVDHPFGVQVLESEYELRRVEPGHGFLEAAKPGQVEEKFPPGAVVQHKE